MAPVATAVAGTTASTSAGPATTAPAAPPVPEGMVPEGMVPEGMVKIPPRIYLMGSHAAVGNPEEKPAHEAIVAAFYMDESEVTVAAYQKCVAENGCPKAHDDYRFCNTKEKLAGQRDDHPINCVDLEMATAFCKWAGKRLPTEREWEYAASAGERRRYSWGSTPVPDKKNSCYDHPGGTCPVKSFEPGAFGLYDMTGNNWEWTASRFTPYPSRATADEVIVEKNKLYVYRGGSWSRRFAKWMGTRMRNRWEANKYAASLGMRCAKSIEPLACPPNSAAKDGACVRTSGTILCQERYTWDGKECVPDVPGQMLRATGLPKNQQPAAPGSSAESKSEPVSDVITRSRTPQHDADCQKNWPKTPASYIFKGGKNYPSRKPTVRAAGCVPRDMGWSWTSACCPG